MIVQYVESTQGGICLEVGRLMKLHTAQVVVVALEIMLNQIHGIALLNGYVIPMAN